MYFHPYNAVNNTLLIQPPFLGVVACAPPAGGERTVFCAAGTATLPSPFGIGVDALVLTFGATGLAFSLELNCGW